MNLQAIKADMISRTQKSVTIKETLPANSAFIAALSKDTFVFNKGEEPYVQGFFVSCF